MRSISVFVLFLICVGSQSGSTFTKDKIDTTALEQLISQKINAIRAKAGQNELADNAVLKMAAEDQAKYISQLGRLSHKQPKKEKAKTRNRVEFYGGKMQGIGENTAYIKIFQTALFRGEKGAIDTVKIESLEKAADYIVYAWMNSPVHKQNILYPKYTVSGVKVEYNKERKALYGVQVFAYPYP
ncbi:MAG: hypothetical protein ACI8SE_001268 [Bacteroidia bacterium]|jgi:uncharacterized protein YkwD